MHPLRWMVLLGAVSLSACTAPTDPAGPHHRPEGFVNSDPQVQIGQFPWLSGASPLLDVEAQPERTLPTRRKRATRGKVLMMKFSCVTDRMPATQE